MLIEALKALLIGLVEGITEWLPISSTGHMILVDEFVKLQVSDSFLALFLVVIQIGAIMAVIILYFHKLNPFSPSKSSQEKKDTWQLWAKVVISIIPSGLVGVLFDDWMDANLHTSTVVAAMLILLALGASDETICADYAQTNVCRRAEIEAVMQEHADEIAADPSCRNHYYRMAGVSPEAAPFVLDTIRSQFGSAENYLGAEYGLTPARLMRLRRMYLE